MYKAEFSKNAYKDAKIAKANGFKNDVDRIIAVVRRAPFEQTPGHNLEKLSGPLKGKYSRRITGFHRFIYEVLPNAANLTDENGEPYEGIVYVLRMWGHNYRP